MLNKCEFLSFFLNWLDHYYYKYIWSDKIFDDQISFEKFYYLNLIV